MEVSIDLLGEKSEGGVVQVRTVWVPSRVQGGSSRGYENATNRNHMKGSRKLKGRK